MARRTFPKDAGERVTLQVRTTTRTRDRLQEVAAASGRSMSQELEMRLEQSLAIKDISDKTGERVLKYIADRDELLQMFLGGTETIDFLIDVALLMGGVSTDGKQWFESSEARAQLFRTLEAALPALIKAPRTGNRPSPLLRSMEYLKYLPEKPKTPAPEMPKGARFMTDEELKQFFYLNDDNADEPGSKAAKKRQRSVRAPLDKE